MQYKILIYQPFGPSALVEGLSGDFPQVIVDSEDGCLALAAGDEFKVLVIDFLAKEELNFDNLEFLFSEEGVDDLPIILLSPSKFLTDKLRAFELGCDDVLAFDDNPEEVSARISKSIFNSIANEQLKSRLRTASQTATSVLADNNDLGSHIQFLLDINTCENIDELGQMFFVALDRYELSCSLQMRSQFGVKNMEANGMAKDLESELLSQLSHIGNFTPFGRRSIFNCGNVGLLVRDMPIVEDKRYDAIRNYLPALLQGVNARLNFLDSHRHLSEDNLRLSAQVEDQRITIANIEQAYSIVAHEVTTIVEDMAELVKERIPQLVVSEEHEVFLEQLMQDCVTETHRHLQDGFLLTGLEKIENFDQPELLGRPSAQGGTSKITPSPH
ncbi:hypothetical protein NBRC116493_06150 [Aurantivibrio infirmus]